MISPLILLVSQDFLNIIACFIFQIKFRIDFRISVLPFGSNDQEILMLFKVSVTNRDAIWLFCFATVGGFITQCVLMEQCIADVHFPFEDHFLAYYCNLVETTGQTIGRHQLTIRFELAIIGVSIIGL